MHGFDTRGAGDRQEYWYRTAHLAAYFPIFMRDPQPATHSRTQWAWLVARWIPEPPPATSWHDSMTMPAGFTFLAQFLDHDLISTPPPASSVSGSIGYQQFPAARFRSR